MKNEEEWFGFKGQFGLVQEREDPLVREREDPLVREREDPLVREREDPLVREREDPLVLPYGNALRHLLSPPLTSSHLSHLFSLYWHR